MWSPSRFLLGRRRGPRIGPALIYSSPEGNIDNVNALPWRACPPEPLPIAREFFREATVWRRSRRDACPMSPSQDREQRQRARPDINRQPSSSI